jgi:hypothetical protein
MTKGHVLLGIVVSIALAPATSAIAGDPIALKQLTVGMTKDEVEKQFPGFTKNCFLKALDDGRVPCMYMKPRDGESWRTPIEAMNTLADAPVKSWTIFFRDDKVSSVLVSLPTLKFDQVSAALAEKYGKPEFDEKSTVQNRMGASFDQHEMIWKRDGTVLDVRQRAGRIDDMAVRLTSESEMEKSKPKPKKDAKDL